MDLLSYSCNMCGEQHRKYLSSSTNRTTCRKCGNLIELSPQINNIPRNNRFHINLNNRNSSHRNDPFNFDSDDEDNKDSEFTNTINSNLDSDFYDFNRYNGHNDYLPSRDTINHYEDLSELNDNFLADEFDQFYMGNIINNNRQSKPLKLTNTRYNFSNINLNKNTNNPFPRNSQRSLSTHHFNNNYNNYFNSTNLNNNRANNNSNNNQNNGMFSIQIANDNYDRYSAFHHRSNFGYRGEDSNIHNFDDLDDIIEHEIEYDLNLMSRRNEHNNPLRRSLELVGNLVIKPEKPKIKLEKIKMTKDLNTKNDGEKNESPACCICLAPMKLNQEVTLLKCQHLFHYKCLDKWVENKEICPFCRGKIEFAKINKKGKDKKEDVKVEDKKININSNLGAFNKNINIRPIIGDRKSNIIFSNKSIFNSINKNTKKKK